MAVGMDNNPPARTIYTVSGLTAELKTVLEEQFPIIWVEGEISNFARPASGHFYFTLKDDSAQIAGVMFKGQNRSLRFRPEDGMEVTGLGRIGVYAPRGSYQVIFEYLEPKGVGALQVAFEQLKRKLSAEGLFDADRKRPIPRLPRRVGVITSRTGAAVHDVLTVIGRRFANIPVIIYPVRVQGDGADAEIVRALALANERRDADVLIVCRGGGSLEDLSPFNSEAVARAIFASTVPVISAVGHETDVTIADFVADLRAPTPSAAAELAVPRKADLSREVARLTLALSTGCQRTIERHRRRLAEVSRRLVHPRKRVEEMRLRLDDVAARLNRGMTARLVRERERLKWRNDRLQSLSPTAILKRGYSIAREVPGRRVIRDAGTVEPEATVELLLWKGSLTCRVESVTDDEEKTDL